MFGRNKAVRIPRALLDRAAKASTAAGYPDVSEFVTHLLEKELAKLEGASDEKELRDRLRGLGYIS